MSDVDSNETEVPAATVMQTSSAAAIDAELGLEQQAYVLIVMLIY